jgi:hypothetical protein
VQNLWAVLIEDFIERTLVRCTSRGEGSGSNVILEELFVDDVDDGRDKSFDVFGVVDEGFNVTCGIHALILL